MKSSRPDTRFLVVLTIGALLGIACIARIMLNRTQDFESQVSAASVMRPAPGFEALDANNHLVRLGSWLGRHRIIVVFFDAQEGAERDLLRLRDHYSEMQALDVKVVGVTDALPQQIRAAIDRAGGAFPFPLVSDFDPQSADGQLRIHRHWGRLDTVSGKPLTGVFLIDRRGYVAHVGPIPKSYENSQEILDLLKKSA